ncbi:hypothetical protein J437_LFUL000601 [Ladona fulva]|uniref:Regulatory protein zeste n=1 Tax=Ladona fulva TaxID=123851 RepID=A0A8K0NZN7_LADFU|nr:hypothetical protein J437_LFUL000601 [Ladona fulva]
MERHPDLAHGRLTGISAKAKGVAMWEELTSILNTCKGGPKKPAYKWQKTWCDWKSYTKRKSAKIRKSQESSEGSTSTSPALSFLERRLLNLLEPEETDEDTSLPEGGLSPPETLLEEAPAEETELPEIDPQPTRPALKRKGGEDMMLALVNVEEKRLKIEENRREVEYRNVEALMGIGNSIHRFAEAMERIATCFEGYLSDNKQNFEK